MNKTFIYQDVTYEIHLHPMAHIINTTTGHKPQNQGDIAIDYLNTQGFNIPKEFSKHHAVKLINKLLNNLPLDQEEQSFQTIATPQATTADVVINADETAQPTTNPEADQSTIYGNVEVTANCDDTNAGCDAPITEDECCGNPAPTGEGVTATVINDITNPGGVSMQQQAPADDAAVPVDETPID